MLTEAQLAQYHDDGYVIPDYRLSDQTLDAIRAAHTGLLKAHPQYIDYCPTLLLCDTGFLEFAKDPTIVDMVCQVLGEDVALWNSSFFAKPARVGSKTPWHQDGEYWPMRPLATCTVWMAIDDSTVENGCLQVIRGSHKGKHLRKHQINDAPGLSLNQELPSTEFDESQAVNMEMEAGQISLHDVYLVHGSEPNRSNKPRRGMTLRFMPTTSYYDRAIEREQHERAGLNIGSRRPVYLMRGVDRHGQNDFENQQAMLPPIAGAAE